MEELIQRKLAQEAADKELQEFVELLTSAKKAPLQAKPQKSSWLDDENIRVKIESLECYAIDDCRSDDLRKLAGSVNCVVPQIAAFISLSFSLCA